MPDSTINSPTAEAIKILPDAWYDLLVRFAPGYVLVGVHWEAITGDPFAEAPILFSLALAYLISFSVQPIANPVRKEIYKIAVTNIIETYERKRPDLFSPAYPELLNALKAVKDGNASRAGSYVESVAHRARLSGYVNLSKAHAEQWACVQLSAMALVSFVVVLAAYDEAARTSVLLQSLHLAVFALGLLGAYHWSKRRLEKTIEKCAANERSGDDSASTSGEENQSS